MLRLAILAYAAIQLAVAGALLFLAHLPLWSALYLGVNGVVTIAALIFERRRYQPRVDRATGDWQDTGERFVDATTGRVMEVRYNPATGQRDYREARE